MTLDNLVVTRTVGALLHMTNNLICVGRGTAGGLALPCSGAGMLAPNNYRAEVERSPRGGAQGGCHHFPINIQAAWIRGGSVGMWGDNSIFVSRLPVIQK